MSCEGITVLLVKDIWNRSLQPIWRQGFSALASLCPRKALGYDQSWVCASWTGPFMNLLSRCSCWEVHLRMHPSPRSFCSGWPEGPVLPCVDLSVPQVSPAVGVRRMGISVQVPALQAVPIAPCLHESSGGSPCSFERTGRAHSQLPWRLAHAGSVSGSVMRTQGFGALAPHPVGPLGQLGKDQTLPDAEDLFSRYEVGLGQSDSALHAGTCSVGVELLEYVQEQDGDTTPPLHFPQRRQTQP